MSLTRTRAAAATLAGVLASTVVSCGGDDPGSAEAPLRLDDGKGTVAMAVEGDRVYTFADIHVCLESGGPAELLSLSAVGATSGGRVSDFDVVDVHPKAYSGYPRPLDLIERWDSRQRVVDNTCADGSRPSLAIEVTKSREVARAQFPSFLLTYRADGKEIETPVQISLALCNDFDRCDP